MFNNFIRMLSTGVMASTLMLMNVSSSVALLAGDDVPVPNQSAPQQNSLLVSRMSWFLGVFAFAVISACVAGFLFASFKLATSYRQGELGESGMRLGTIAFACILIAGATSFVKTLV